jgi:hypothetical protein
MRNLPNELPNATINRIPSQQELHMKVLRVILINALIFMFLLAGVEIFYRFKAGNIAVAGTPNGLALALKPYVVFANPSNFHYTEWVNLFTGEHIKADARSNNEGYNDPRDFDWKKPYNKAPNEKVVLAVGGSTMWGLGSTNWDNTIAGSMQKTLNEAQSETKYTVINLGMGSWIAYQQFIGLEMWGATFKPDWVVVMDGHNDAGVGCSTSQGVTNPLYFPVIKGYIDAYLGAGVTRPVFFRGSWENELIRLSAAYRAITGESYIKDPLEYDSANKDNNDNLRKVIIPTKMGASRDMLRFYIKATEASLSLFPQAKYILSTQPMVNTFTGDFVDTYKNSPSEGGGAEVEKRDRDLEVYLSAHENELCSTGNYAPSFAYVFGKGAYALEKMAAEKRAEGRFVQYYNIGRIFPIERADRIKYFLDPPHLNDAGANVVGKFYASRILAVDKPAR